MWWDTHCHLTDERLTNTAVIINDARKVHVNKIIIPSTSLSDARKAATLSKMNDLFFAAGIHPHNAASFSEASIIDFEALVGIKNCVAIGEIGLDYHYINSLKEEQALVFFAMLDLAAEHDMPVVLHTRDAEWDVFSTIDQYKSLVGVCHSYTGDKKILGRFFDRGFYVSFNGMLTFKSNENIRKLAEYAPLDRILIETDAPYLAPVPYRGKINSPGFIPFIGQALADIKCLDIEEIAAQTSNNAATLFIKT